MATHLEPGALKEAAEIGLRKLKQGNARFVRGEARFPTVCKETLASLAKEQKPYATILGCSDSRVPPKLIFDANFGELFIVRVAGTSHRLKLWAACNMRALTCEHPCFWCLATMVVAP